MYIRAPALASVALPALVAAGAIPTYDGMTVVFSDEFTGEAGDPINTDVWNIATCKSVYETTSGSLLTDETSHRHQLRSTGVHHSNLEFAAFWGKHGATRTMEVLFWSMDQWTYRNQDDLDAFGWQDDAN